MTRKADLKGLPEYTNMLRDQWFLDCRTNIPGIVRGYAVLGKRPVCDVVLGPKQILGEGKFDDLPFVERVPIGYLVMGSITIRAPLEVGQGVWCSVSDRQLDLFLTGGGKTYAPMRGTYHDENDILAMPQLTFDANEPTVEMNPAELYIGDKTGTKTYIRMNTRTGETTIRSDKTVKVISPAVILGETGPEKTIARVGSEGVIIGSGSSAGTYPIQTLPVGPPSLHKLKG